MSSINNFKSEIALVIIGTVAFIAGFALNDAVSSLIDEHYPKNNITKVNSRLKLLYALVLIIVTYITIKMNS